MTRSSMKVAAALLAAMLLALAGLSGVAAHGPGGDPGHPGFPGTSARPLPSGWAWPSDLPSHAVKTFKPEPSKSPLPTHSPKTPKVKPPVDCTPVVIPTASTAAVTTGFKTSAFGKGKDEALGLAVWNQRMGLLKAHFDAGLRAFYCAPLPLQKVLDGQISSRIKTIQAWVKEIGGTGLSSTDKATVDAELNGLISDLQTFKTKVDGETTLAGLQADYQTFKTMGGEYRVVQLWVEDIVGAERLISSEPGLVALETTIASGIAGAPAGPETDDAQLFLNDMKLGLTTGEAIVTPLPGELLAITSGELADGSATSTLTSVKMQLSLANWYFKLAHWAAKWAQQEIKDATATPKLTATPVVTPTPVPTATP